MNIKIVKVSGIQSIEREDNDTWPDTIWKTAKVSADYRLDS